MKSNPLGPVQTYKFKSQFSKPIKGMMACTVISRVFAARMLRMTAEEFFRVFNLNKGGSDKTAKDVLNGCLQAGVELKSQIEPGLFGGWKRSAYADDTKKINELPDNYAGVKSLQTVADAVAAGTSFENMEVLQSSLYSLYKKHYLENAADQNPDELCFVATSEGHTTVFFSKINPDDNQRYFIGIDSFAGLAKGELNVFQSFEALAHSLIQKWQHSKDNIADITVVKLDPQHNPECNTGPRL